ncbi:uncharacterized protein LOC115226075 isoform X6 [Octopus sinensis]|uniref:Uncharacterized protein LOC115226075 isoform X6 n=1 Tax=Octopus sinensis TaxID=2607531 RepID=A0A7E6FT55_9MOLL|nr:uncharacterized protein LOC115226075 isoform X6 [Octopus sinensis]
MTASCKNSICAESSTRYKICNLEDMKDAVEEESHEEELPDGSKVKHKLMRVRSESIDKKLTEKLVKVVEKLKAPKEHTTVEDYETVLPDGTIHRVHKVIKHSVSHIQREHQHEGMVEKVFDGVVKIPGSESQETLETFERPPHPETIVEQVEEVLPSGQVQKRKIIKNRMIHNIKTRHESFDNDLGQQNEEYEIDEVIPGTETCFYADIDGSSNVSSASCSDVEDMEEESDTKKTDLGTVQEVCEDGTIVTKEIVETRTTTTRTLHSRSGSVDKETTESVITEEFITPTPSPRSGSPIDEMKK